MKLVSGNLGRVLLLLFCGFAFIAWQNGAWWHYLLVTFLPFITSAPYPGISLFRWTKRGDGYFPPIFGDRGIYAKEGAIEFRPAYGNVLSYPLYSLENVSIDKSDGPSSQISMIKFSFAVNGTVENPTLFRSMFSIFFYRNPNRTFALWLAGVPALEEHIRAQVLSGKVISLVRPYAELHLGNLDFRWNKQLEVNGQKVEALAVESATGRSDYVLTTPVGKALACRSQNSNLIEFYFMRMLLRGELGFAAPQITEPARFWRRDVFSVFRRR
jgi:hypothetical protein